MLLGPKHGTWTLLLASHGRIAKLLNPEAPTIGASIVTYVIMGGFLIINVQKTDPKTLFQL